MNAANKFCKAEYEIYDINVSEKPVIFCNNTLPPIICSEHISPLVKHTSIYKLTTSLDSRREVSLLVKIKAAHLTHQIQTMRMIDIHTDPHKCFWQQSSTTKCILSSM